MIDWPKFSEGFAFLAAVYGREVDTTQAKAYHRVLGRHFTDETWARAVREVAESERFWPVPAVFVSRLKAAEEAALRIEAERMFRAVERSYAHSPAGGAYYDRGEIERRFGPRVVEAFDAAGGSRAFRCEEETNQAFVRKAFVEAYVAVVGAGDVRGEQRPCLPPPTPRAALPPAPPESRVISAEVSLELLERVRQRIPKAKPAEALAAAARRAR